MTGRTGPRSDLTRYVVAGLDFLEGGRAACRDHDPELFFDDERAVEAAAVCFGCPIRAGCGTFGASTDAHGVWGGRQPRAKTGMTVSKADEVAARREDVAELLAAGVDRLDIARRLGLHRDVVYADVAHLRRVEIEARYPTAAERVDAACLRGEKVLIGPDETNEALDRLDDGSRTLMALTERLHVSAHTVYRRRRERAGKAQVAA